MIQSKKRGNKASVLRGVLKDGEEDLKNHNWKSHLAA